MLNKHRSRKINTSRKTGSCQSEKKKIHAGLVLDVVFTGGRERGPHSC